jgi:hypothetical protein
MTDDLYDCETTATKIIKKIVPSANPSLLIKNRLTDVKLIINRNWTVGHLYIELEHLGCHHCILKKHNESIDIIDSFVYYRPQETRRMEYQRFCDFLNIICSASTKEERMYAYVLLFNPPPSTTLSLAKSREVVKIYLEQLN